MQRARRLASVAVVACLTVGGLSACRNEPDVAVYLGSGATITVAQVQRVYDDARAKLEAAMASAAQAGEQAGASAAATAPVEVPFTGPDVVSAMLGHDLATRVAAARKVTAPTDIPLDQVAATLKLPADAEYVRIYAETRLLLNKLIQDAPAGAAPDDADVRHVFEVFEGTGQMQPGLTYEQFRSGVSPEALQTLGKAVGVKKDMQAQIDQLDIEINPRYQTSEISVYAEQVSEGAPPLTLLSVPLTDADSSTVIDPA